MTYRFAATITLVLWIAGISLSALAAGEPDGTTITASEEKTAASIGDMTVATFGGAYGQALDIAVLKPFADLQNISINLVHHSKNEDTLAALGNDGPKPDVIELDRKAIDAACAAGLLAKRVGAETDPADGGAETQQVSEKKDNADILDGFHHDCGVASLSWSAVTVFNTKRLAKKPPRGLSDLFNLKRVPGKRAFVARPEYLFETLLMADGVRPSKVYETLATEAGVKRALNRLARVARNIVWADTPTEALGLVESGQAVMGQAFNGRVFIDSARGAPIAIVWDGQIQDTNYFAIPANAKDQKQSEDFITFATDATQLANHAQHLAYGPLKRSAIAQLTTHPTLGIELAPYIPTHPKNRKRSLRRDAAWWEANSARLEHALIEWRASEATVKVAPVARKVRKKRYRKRRKKRRRRKY